MEIGVMSTHPGYPRRESHFAHRFVRLLHNSEAAQVIGPAACYLLCIIAHAEDARRYAGPAEFWRTQLLKVLGFRSPKQLVEARKKAISGGWLVYEQDGTRGVGKYFVTIPERFAGLSDAAIEPAISSASGTNNGTNRNGSFPPLVPLETHKRNGKGSISGTQSGSLPIPSPIPNPEREAAPLSAGADALSLEELVERWNQIPGIVHCRGPTDKRRRAFRARMQDRAWREGLDDALAGIVASSFLRGENGRGWKADIDWFLKPDSLTKVLEGKYADADRLEPSSIYPTIALRRRQTEQSPSDCDQ
jgi:hypothetical protein